MSHFVAPAPGPRTTLAVLGDEGLRLFFPLAAVHAALWPFLWVVVHGYDLPFVREVPPSLWHAHEMIIGSFGAALIGFITTAVPEWTDTPRPRGRPLFVLAGLWAAARVAGFAGADVLGIVAAALDLAWLCGLLLFVARVSWQKRTTRLVAFLFWIGALAAAEAVTRYGFVTGDVALAQAALRQGGFAFLALLGLALARITVPITNLVLDPTEATSPFRPHPGRLNLAPGLVAVMMAGDLASLSETTRGYLAIAAGAAFLDRTAEAFVGRAFFRGEILALGGSSALAGLGLLLVGTARLGLPLPETTGLHVALMGGLGGRRADRLRHRWTVAHSSAAGSVPADSDGARLPRPLRRPAHRSRPRIRHRVAPRPRPCRNRLGRGLPAMAHGILACALRPSDARQGRAMLIQRTITSPSDHQQLTFSAFIWAESRHSQRPLRAPKADEHRNPPLRRDASQTASSVPAGSRDQVWRHWHS
jgi:uncharacterized protein involved in response to NO